jgi:hypothetical protein
VPGDRPPSRRRPGPVEDVEVRAIVDPVLEQAEELADHVSVAAYRSYLDMLDAKTWTPCTAALLLS